MSPWKILRLVLVVVLLLLNTERPCRQIVAPGPPAATLEIGLKLGPGSGIGAVRVFARFAPASRKNLERGTDGLRGTDREPAVVEIGPADILESIAGLPLQAVRKALAWYRCEPTSDR